jgi:hypothetical protein
LSTRTTSELLSYYQSLLILQYVGKLKARETIATVATGLLQTMVSKQEISFDVAPTTGQFVLRWQGSNSLAIDYNDSEADIQTAIRSITGLDDVTVSGDIQSGSFVVTFLGVDPVASLLTVFSTTLDAAIAIAEIDKVLPLAVQDAFNVIGDNIAQGVQLDVIGKYVGVDRVSRGFTQQIVLDDTDYLTLIKMAIIRNGAQSDLGTITAFLEFFFPGQVLVFDNQLMQLSYLISSSVGSVELIQVFLVQNLLPKPMAVALTSTIYAPVINKFFGCVQYNFPFANNNTPFNTYADYRLDWPWLSYQNSILFL